MILLVLLLLTIVFAYLSDHTSKYKFFNRLFNSISKVFEKIISLFVSFCGGLCAAGFIVSPVYALLRLTIDSDSAIKFIAIPLVILGVMCSVAIYENYFKEVKEIDQE